MLGEYWHPNFTASRAYVIQFIISNLDNRGPYVVYKRVKIKED
jgi:hypothetical protein